MTGPVHPDTYRDAKEWRTRNRRRGGPNKVVMTDRAIEILGAAGAAQAFWWLLLVMRPELEGDRDLFPEGVVER